MIATLNEIKTNNALEAWQNNIDATSKPYELGQAAFDISHKITGGGALVAGAKILIPAKIMSGITAFFAHPVTLATGAGISGGHTAIALKEDNTRQAVNGMFDMSMMALPFGLNQLQKTQGFQTLISNAQIFKTIRQTPPQNLATQVLNHQAQLTSWPQPVLQATQRALLQSTQMQNIAPALSQTDDVRQALNLITAANNANTTQIAVVGAEQGIGPYLT